MSEGDAPQAPEVLREIRAAEQSVEAMIQKAEREAAGILERARVAAARPTGTRGLDGIVSGILKGGGP